MLRSILRKPTGKSPNTVQLARQRVIVKQALDTGQRSEMAESLLDAPEGSLRIFEKHRVFLLSLQRSSSALPPSEAATGRSLSRRNGHGALSLNHMRDQPRQKPPSRDGHGPED